jgi:hypothetical protein
MTVISDLFSPTPEPFVLCSRTKRRENYSQFSKTKTLIIQKDKILGLKIEEIIDVNYNNNKKPKSQHSWSAFILQLFRISV